MRRLIVALCVLLAATVPACSPELTGGYFVRDGKAYWSGGIDSGSHEVVGADAGSFHPFNDDYARDKSRVYYHDAAISGADASSFKVLGDGYALDKSRAYYRGGEIPGAEVSTFRLLDSAGSGLAKDRNHVWAGREPISNDPTHFQLLSRDLAKDSAAVFCGFKVISDDPSHFEVVRFSKKDQHDDYAKDSRAVYYLERGSTTDCLPIPGADPATFHRLNDSPWNYAADDQHVYYLNRLIVGADPRTIRVLLDIGNDACAADAQHAYSRDTVIPNVDPRSFPPGKAVTGCDDTHVAFAS
jgi:hypothetical protein